MKRNLLIVLVFFLWFSLHGCSDSGRSGASSENSATLSQQPDCNILLINTYLTRIQEAVDDFYAEYFTIGLRADYYVVSVKEIRSNGETNPTSLVTFLCEPFVGPHDSVGLDEITFSADYVGNVELKEFKHIKSFTLPDNLKDLAKKPIPGEYEPL